MPDVEPLQHTEELRQLIHSAESRLLAIPEAARVTVVVPLVRSSHMMGLAFMRGPAGWGIYATKPCGKAGHVHATPAHDVPSVEVLIQVAHTLPLLMEAARQGLRGGVSDEFRVSTVCAQLRDWLGARLN